MKRIVVLVSVLALLALLAATAAATRTLSKAEAKVKATSALQNYFGDTWRFSTEKSVQPERRISPSRWELSYYFEYDQAKEQCYGTVIVFRGRGTQLFPTIKPSPDLSDPYCR